MLKQEVFKWTTVKGGQLGFYILKREQSLKTAAADCLSVQKQGMPVSRQWVVFFSTLRFYFCSVYIHYIPITYTEAFDIKDSGSAAWIIYKIIPTITYQAHARHLTPKRESQAMAFLNTVRSQVNSQHTLEQMCIVVTIETTCWVI